MEGSSAHLRCSVHIDLCAMERNLGKLRHFMGREKGYIALLSADAFGYGVEAAVVRLMLSGADAFAVTNAEEGARVREVGPGWKIIVMSSSLPGEESAYFENSLTPVLAGAEEVSRFEAAAKAAGRTLPVHLRLPVFGDALPSRADATEMLEKILESPFLRLEAFCLPGAGSGAPVEGSEPDAEFLSYAASRLGAAAGSVYIHHGDVCELSALPPEFDRSLRAGLVLFGIRPSEKSILRGFEPERVLVFRTSVSLVKELPKGATVGYGRTFRLERDSKIALLSVGYGDGVPREGGGRMSVLIRGARVPVIGRVSMDQAAVDASGLADVREGDEAVIVGPCGNDEISIEEYCGRLGITPAQALTSITKRVARFYKTLY